MPSIRVRGRRPKLVVTAAAMALLSVLAAPASVAARPVDPAPPVSDPPSTEVPTTVAPTTTLPPGPSTTVAAGPTTTVRGGSTTSSTSTSLPTDTPVGATPAPLVPSADTDPLFHVARLVDADYVAVEKATKVFGPLRAAHRAFALRARDAQRSFDSALAANRQAAAAASRAESRMKGVVMRAYTGYGKSSALITDVYQSNQRDNGAELTYTAVATDQLRARIALTKIDHARTLGRLQAAYDSNRAATLARRAHAAQVAAARRTLRDAKKQLDVDTKALMAEVALSPDLAGTLATLPTDVKRKPGDTIIPSPAGPIVLPAKADRRTLIAIAYVIRQYGKPYVWGATGPDTYDCSGLMLRAFQAAGVTSMPRVSQAQQVWATPVEPKDARPGDLVFFGRPAYHVGMYIGGGLMINAPYSGSHVRVDRVWSSFTGFGRVVWPAA